MTHCKHCQKKCKTFQTCSDYEPYSIDALEKEKRTASPERLKEILAKLDFYYYGKVIYNEYKYNLIVVHLKKSCIFAKEITNK